MGTHIRRNRAGLACSGCTVASWVDREDWTVLPCIEVSGLQKSWPLPGGDRRVAVDDVSFTVQPGEVLGLLGPNGAGKTTTLRMLVGLEKPDAGWAKLAGVDVQADPSRARRSLGYLSTTSGLPARLTVREALEVTAQVQGVADVQAAVERVVEVFDLGGFTRQFISTLSTGMLQRTRLAVALVHHPPLLVLDEPASGLDVVAAEELLSFVTLARTEGAAVLLSTHVIDEAERVCDRVLILLDGKVAALGTPAELCAVHEARSLRDVFRGLVHARRAESG
jgi:sodium transport system ATP-binding protein